MVRVAVVDTTHSLRGCRQSQHQSSNKALARRRASADCQICCAARLVARADHAHVFLGQKKQSLQSMKPEVHFPSACGGYVHDLESAHGDGDCKRAELLAFSLQTRATKRLIGRHHEGTCQSKGSTST